MCCRAGSRVRGCSAVSFVPIKLAPSANQASGQVPFQRSSRLCCTTFDCPSLGRVALSVVSSRDWRCQRHGTRWPHPSASRRRYERRVSRPRSPFELRCFRTAGECRAGHGVTELRFDITGYDVACASGACRWRERIANGTVVYLGFEVLKVLDSPLCAGGNGEHACAKVFQAAARVDKADIQPRCGPVETPIGPCSSINNWRPWSRKHSFDAQRHVGPENKTPVFGQRLCVASGHNTT